MRVESLKLKGGDAKAVAKADDAEREALALDNKLSSEWAA